MDKANKVMTWQYGVTTVPSRSVSHLPATLASLREAGFPSPRLFVDGAWGRVLIDYEAQYPQLEVTGRHPAVRTAANWLLSMFELYLRGPNADRYVVFQDDAVFVRNLRQYLERCPHNDNSYLNLYTSPANQTLCPSGHRGWYQSNQLGRGALALVFSRPAVVKLLGGGVATEYLVGRAQNAVKGWKSIDGGISVAMRNAGWKEYVHNPSLCQHVGKVTATEGNLPQPPSVSFPGEDFDALTLLPLRERTEVGSVPAG